MSTTIQQIERMKTGHNKIATGMDGKWQKNCYRGNIHPLRVSNPNWHESSMPVGLPAGEKKRWRSVAYFLSKSDLKQQYKPGAVLALRGHLRSLPMVPFDRRQNFLYFLFPGPCAYLMSFWSYGEKNESSENQSWLLWKRPLKIQKSRFRSFIYSHSGTERESCVKIHPVEVEIIGLTEHTHTHTTI